MYNLVILAQQGHILPLSVHGLFNVTHQDEQKIVVEKILKRCYFQVQKTAAAMNNEHEHYCDYYV